MEHLGVADGPVRVIAFTDDPPHRPLASTVSDHELTASRRRGRLTVNVGAVADRKSVWRGQAVERQLGDAAVDRTHLERALEIWPRVPDAEERTGLDQAEVASLALPVLRLAREGDKVASELAEQSARDLVALVVSLLDSFGGKAPPVATAGGLLDQEPLKTYAKKALAEHNTAMRDDALDPVAGAIQLAAAL